MIEGGAGGTRNPEDRLADSRAQFVASLGERLAVLHRSLSNIADSSAAAAVRGSFQRRVHAMAAAAEVLGFAEASAAFKRIETALPTLNDENREAVVAEISHLLDAVPNLVLGGDAPPSLQPAAVDAPEMLSVVFVGLEPLAEGLRQLEDKWEVLLTPVAADVGQLLRSVVPDIVVIDAEQRRAREVVESIISDETCEEVRIVVIGSFERPETAAGFLHAGVHRVLPRPVSPATLQRHLRELCREGRGKKFELEPLGDLTLTELSERISREVRRGLLESAKPGSRDSSISFGDGVEVLAAVWGAVARVRELANMRSGGLVNFDASGPEGAVTLAPWGGSERGVSALAARDAQDVSLQGRRIVVADDDPAVAWFITGVLRASGAEVIEAPDGERALAAAYDTWPDLVLSDLLMPGLDGFELCRRLKRDVALSDVPIVLLSWKEDLLQRVRELGARADAYLQKEASGSVIVRSVREVLRTRARIEERFRKNSEVRGRLDTVTPRLILELTARFLGNATVSIRDAAYLYEVELRSSRLLCATRTTNEGHSEGGIAVLAELLGVRAGRFAVRSSSRAVAPLFDGTLAELTAQPIARARAAQGLFSETGFARLGRIDIDTERVASYLTVSPLKVRELVNALSEGASPWVLAQENGERLLEATLSDLALHAGILEVYDTGGAPLLAGATAALAAHIPRLSLSEEEGKASGNPTPAEFDQIAEATLLGETKAPAQANLAASGTSPFTVSATPRSVAPPAPAMVVARGVGRSQSFSAAGNSESSSTMRGGFKLTDPALAAEAKISSAAPARSSDAPDVFDRPTAIVLGDALITQTARRSLAPRTRAESNPLGTTLPAADDELATSADSTTFASPAVPERRTGPRTLHGMGEVDLADALVSGMLNESPHVAHADPAIFSSELMSNEGAEQSTQVDSMDLLLPSLPALESRPRKRASVQLSKQAKVARTDVEPDSALAEGLSPLPAGAEKFMAESRNDALLESLTEESQSSKSGGPEVRPVLAPGHISAFGSSLELSNTLDEERFFSQRPPAADAMEPLAIPASRAPRARPLDINRDRGALTQGSTIEREAGRTLPNDGKAREPKTSLRPSSEGGRATPAPRAGAAAIVLGLVSAGGAFALTNWWLPAKDAATEMTEPTSSPEAQTSEPAALSSGATVAVNTSAGAAGEAAAGAAAFAVRDLALPAELTVAPGKGLLEVQTGQGHRVYVGGVFVGPGPLRRVPLSPGVHDIRLSSDGVDSSVQVEVKAGMRTQVEGIVKP